MGAAAVVAGRVVGVAAVVAVAVFVDVVFAGVVLSCGMAAVIICFQWSRF